MNRRRADSVVSMPGEGGARTRVLLLRHGAAEGSQEGFFYGSTDVALLPEGKEQVREAAGRVREWLLAGETTLLASPLARALGTAEILADALGLAAQPGVVPGLAELHLGEWEGESHASLMRKDPEGLRAHYANFAHSRPPGGGESLEDLAARVLPAFREACAGAGGANLLIAAHAAVNRVILCDALGAPLGSFFRLEQDFAALNVIDLGGSAPLVRAMNL